MKFLHSSDVETEARKQQHKGAKTSDAMSPISVETKLTI